MSQASDLKVLIVASEINPYAKSGGLGDVIGSLPQALHKLGVDCRVVFPKYRSIHHDLLKNLTFIHSFIIRLNWRNQSTAIYEIDAGVPTYLIENDFYFGREGFYSFWDDDERFAFFTKASVEFLNYIDFQPDIIHFNDWQTGLGSLYLRDYYGGLLFYRDIKTVYTIHNMQYQGNFSKTALSHADLNDGYFTVDKLEFHGRTSFMKAGIVYADAVTTVSETYAREIQTPEYGYGMDGLLRSVSHKLSGIVNGIDTVENNPETDPRIAVNYSVSTLDKKKLNKQALQKELGLGDWDVPLISIVSRLVDQKGLDLVALALEELLDMDIQLVILGTGDGFYEHRFGHAGYLNPKKMSANIYFNADLAQRIYAASDMFLMPSLFEPCGLGQLFSMRYGSIPIVRQTGGLADTVSHFNPETGEGNGFVFKDYVADGMMWAVRQALHTYRDTPENWQKLMVNAMTSDFSWDTSAKRYVALYLKLKNGQ